MEKEGKKYVVHGMKVECSEGSMQNYIITDKGHGVVYQEHPLLNANDHTPQVNLTHFGDCKSIPVYDKAKKQADEKYQADANDGFFSSAGKFVAQTVITAKEHFGANKCKLDTPLPWMFGNMEHMIDGAPTLTVESQCACRYGGVIKIVFEELETTEMVKVEDKNSDNEEDTDMGLTAGVIKEFSIMMKRELKSLYYINKYVNEDTFCEINPEWKNNMDIFKEVYSEDVFAQLRANMYKYGITDETSVLMFLSAIGEESQYGSRVTERYTQKYLEDKSYTVNTRGAGLIQITGETQKTFLEYIYEMTEDENEKEIVKKYIDGYEKVGEKIDNTYGSATDFVAHNYAVESATWFWAKNKEKCVFTDSKGNGVAMSINEYINSVNAANKDNLFLVTQYCTNGKNKWTDEELQEMCETSQNVEIYTIEKKDKQGNDVTEYRAKYNGNDYRTPNGWKNRSQDWNTVKYWMDEGESIR